MKAPQFPKREWPRRSGSGPMLLLEYRFKGADVLLQHLLRLTGLAPISIRRLKNGCAVSLSYNLMLYSYVKFMIIGLTVAVGFFTDVLAEPDGAERSTLQLVLWTLNIFFALATVGAGAFCSPPRTARLLHYLSQIKKINKEFGGASTKNRRLRFLIALCCFVYVTLFASKIFRLIKYTEEGILLGIYNLLSFYISTFVAVLLEMQIMHVVYHMKRTVQTINDRLRGFLNDLQADKYASRDTKCLREIRHITRKYLEARDLTHQLSKSEGALLFCLFLETAYHINTSSYNFYLSCLLNASNIFLKIGIIIEKFVTSFIYWTSLALLIEPCHETRQELDSTRVLVSELLCCTPSALSPLSKLLQRFAKQLQVSSRVFTPLDVFSFSRSLYTAVIGCLTTYVSVLIQYDMREWSNV